MAARPEKPGIPFWRLPLAELLGVLQAGPEGLSSVEAAARLVRFGPNLPHKALGSGLTF